MYMYIPKDNVQQYKVNIIYSFCSNGTNLFTDKFYILINLSNTL